MRFAIELAVEQADENQTRVFAMAPRGSAIELRPLQDVSGEWSVVSGVVLRLGKPESTTDHSRRTMDIVWRKADGSNATPVGAHPFSRRGAGHSSGAFRMSS